LINDEQRQAAADPQTKPTDLSRESAQGFFRTRSIHFHSISRNITHFYGRRCVLPRIFTPRRVCIARTMPSQGVHSFVCLSVCLSVTRRYSVKTVTSVHKLFHSLVAGHSSFSISNGIPTETPLTVTSDARGYEKIAILDQYLALSPKRYNIQP